MTAKILPLQGHFMIRSTTAIVKRRRKSLIFFFLVAASLLIGCCRSQQDFNEVKFDELVSIVESDAKAFAAQVQKLYQENSCSAQAATACQESSYDHCVSELPNPICRGGVQYDVEACGVSEQSGCSGLYDYTTTTVRLPEPSYNNAQPNDPSVLNALCATEPLGKWWEQKRMQDNAYWTALGVEPVSVYFGAAVGGVFRMYPGRTQNSCGVYDPRVRPWYNAAQTGPKNMLVLLELDSDAKTFNYTKLAAARLLASQSSSWKIPSEACKFGPILVISPLLHCTPQARNDERFSWRPWIT